MEDSLPAHLDLNTLQPGASSHVYKLEIAGTESQPVLLFHFRDIKLTGKKQDSIRSKGQLSFRIRTLDDVARGLTLSNRAHIYFDRNEAVITEFVHTKIAEEPVLTRSDDPVRNSGRLVLAPNPNTGNCRIWIDGLAAARTIRILSLDGRLVREVQLGAGQWTEIRNLDAGVYVVSCPGMKPQQLVVVK